MDKMLNHKTRKNKKCLCKKILNPFFACYYLSNKKMFICSSQIRILVDRFSVICYQLGVLIEVVDWIDSRTLITGTCEPSLHQNWIFEIYGKNLL